MTAPSPRGGAARGPIAGTGVGLRGPHAAELIRERPPVPWLEALVDNHLAPGGPARDLLRSVAGHYPLSFHCVGMSIGGVDPLDFGYLDRVRALAREVGPAWISDHLCFTRLEGRHFHDLLPLPLTEEALAQVAARVQAIQERLGSALVIENVSTYLRFTESALSEAQFLDELVGTTGCGILLDLNNLYVNRVNHGEDPDAYIEALPLAAVREVHLAGHADRGDYLVDAHNDRVAPPVWELYRRFAARCPGVPTLIEWDNDIPPLRVLLEEAARAEAIAATVEERARAP